MEQKLHYLDVAVAFDQALGRPQGTTCGPLLRELNSIAPAPAVNRIVRRRDRT
jgi:hypothetical protein